MASKNVIRFVHHLDTVEGIEERELELPAKWEICSRCDGNGTHVNPNVDGHGITSEEWANEWAEEEKEAYLEGRYDVRCNDCSGSGKRLILDEDAAKQKDPAILQLYFQQLREEAEYQQMCEMERKMGA